MGVGSLKRPLPGVPSPPLPSEESVLARAPWRKNEVKPPVHRARQRDLPYGDLLALTDADPELLRLSKSPRGEGSLSQGQLSMS